MAGRTLTSSAFNSAFLALGIAAQAMTDRVMNPPRSLE